MSTVEDIQITLDDAKALVERMQRAKRLIANPDFKAVILEGYCKEEAVRLVGISADPTLVDSQRDIHEEIHAISLFQGFMRRIQQIGETAEASIESFESELELAEAEEANGDGAGE